MDEISCHAKCTCHRVLDEISCCAIWWYWLLSFQGRDTKLERFLDKKQYCPRTLFHFVNWHSGEWSKIWHLEKIEVIKKHFHEKCAPKLAILNEKIRKILMMFDKENWLRKSDFVPTMYIPTSICFFLRVCLKPNYFKKQFSLSSFLLTQDNNTSQNWPGVLNRLVLCI